MRYDERRGVYRDCKWCAGGCLYCPIEAKRAYEREFPDGPKPIATFDITTPEGIERARRAIGREALQKAFSPDGRGVAEIIENANNPAEAKSE